MKILRLLILSSFLFFTAVLHAQNASNTDTWDETIEYIKWHSECPDFIGCENIKFEGHLYYFYNYNSYNISDLYKIKDVTLNGIWIDLTFLEENSVTYKIEGDQIISKSDIESVPNMKRNEKLLKAYQHLAYLAKIKRQSDEK